jgi:hypothetical protein
LHSTLGKNPFEVLYGHAPRHFGVNVVDSCAIPDLQQWLRDRDMMTELLRQHLERQNLRMKHQADKNRTERHFAVGDWVYLKLHPYVQKSVANQGTRKLAFRFYGPFQVLDKIGKVAYKLDLPPHSQIHPVIHVSQLKKAVGRDTKVLPHLPTAVYQEAVPDMVLGTRWRRKAGEPKCQLLIRWQGLPDALATWEDKNDLLLRFPEHPAWGQAGSKGGGNVMDQMEDMAKSASGKQQRRLRRAGRRPARIDGPEWTP